MGVEYLYDFSVNDYSNAVLSIFRSFFFSILFSQPCNMWDFSSLIRDRTHGPCTGSMESTTGLPGNSLGSVLLLCINIPRPRKCQILFRSLPIYRL